MTTHAAERLEVTGIVQGVGFRPFVHRLAGELGLSGEVGNDSARVFVEVAGPAVALDEFAHRLVTEAPPLAQVDGVVRCPIDPPARAGFAIVESRGAIGERTLVAPDTAACDDCRAELFDPADRRYRHPFITCTNCGPRFTIIRDLPYDRPNTTMAGFEMCTACAAEYRDPGDRRYHAQPISCHDCGPRLRFVRGVDEVTGPGCVAAAVESLRSGETVAIKGLGGYHLACDATDADAVAMLRHRKRRPDKPFAVMVASLADARRLADVSDPEAAELTSAARPIVLLRARRGSPLSALVAPGNPLLGIVVAYTPVHHLLFELGLPPLVMTSGNLGGEPIVHRDGDAITRLAPLADALLTHDRPIHVPCDDSVVRLADDALLPIRRARGYAPVPVPIDGGRRTVLAVGGELKNACCLASIGHAWVSQHLGDMENLETLAAFESTVAQFTDMYDIAPDTVAVDAHPGYLTGRWARSRHGDRLVEVQHHHAHVAAVMAEHGLDPSAPVLGVVFDGTGYGDDGTIWGGEVLAATASGYERLAHLAPVPLPGGDAAIRNPYRVALAHLYAAGIDWDADLPPVAQLDEVERRVLRRQIERGVACVPTSSMGRLFDAVASVLGLRHRITYEAQAAIDLEIAAARSEATDGYRFTIDGSIADPTDVWRAIVGDLRAGAPVDDIARRFHLAVQQLVVDVAVRCREERGLVTTVLSGGVFQNVLLARGCIDALRRAGFEPLTHRLVPPNDGGLALGQAYCATHRRVVDMGGGA